MMKQVLRSLPFALLLAAVVFIAACSKDGAQGPAGAPGPAGTPGTTGPAGPKGDSGKPGSANVIYSAWLDVTYQPQTVTTNGVLDTVAFTAAIPAPKLDSVSLNNALIQVYINLGTPAVARVVVLPYTDENFTIIRYVAGVKSISLISNTNPSTATTASGKRFQYRYVIIPGGVAARAAGIDWKNYGQVQQYLHLQD